MSDLSDAVDEARSEVAELAAEFLPDLMSIYPQGTSETSDGAGGFTLTGGTPIENVPCRHEPLSSFERARESMAGGQLESVSTHSITCPYGTDIRASSYVIVAARGLVPALTFQINGPLVSSTELFLRFGASLKGS